MAEALDVSLSGVHVATITRRGGAIKLRYRSDYVESNDPIPISVQLPVSHGNAPSGATQRFLENLLPDRADVRMRWAREAKLTSDSAFDLLGVYGADVAGTLEFTAAGVPPRAEAELRAVSDSDIAEHIRQIRADDTDWLSRRPLAEGFSLGGDQGKFALARLEGQWFEPSGRVPSTHIFKPGVGALPGSDATEHIIMRTARECGLQVATTDLSVFHGEHALVVERFDRALVHDQFVRLHQEDLAQATDTSVINKYERDGGPSYRRIFEMLDRQLAPAEAQSAKQRFAECLIFSWIVGHNDGHTKNFSLLHLPGTTVLAPFYDLSSVLPFELPELVRSMDYRAFDAVKLAFAIDGDEAIGAIGPQNLRLLETDAGLAAGYLTDFALRIATIVQPIVNRVIEQLPGAVRSLPVVELLPYATYAQARRVVELLA